MSGSDQADSVTSRRLASLGIQVHVGHDAEHIAGAEAVVTSTAVKGDNPEVIAARAKRIPVVPRAVMLAELMRLRKRHRHCRHARQDHHHLAGHLHPG